MPCKINTGDSSENTQLFTQSRPEESPPSLAFGGDPRQTGQWEAPRWKGKAPGAQNWGLLAPGSWRRTN